MDQTMLEGPIHKPIKPIWALKNYNGPGWGDGSWTGPARTVTGSNTGGGGGAIQFLLGQLNT